MITISPTATGTSLTEASAGRSFEADDLTLPGFTSGDLAGYLDTISPSCVLRIGVSNVYASALWEIDDQLVMARDGMAGDSMHGTSAQCGTAKPLYMYYTPSCAENRAQQPTV